MEGLLVFKGCSALLFPALGYRNAFRDVSCTLAPEIHTRGRGVLGERVPEADRHRRSPAGVAVAYWINRLS